MGDVSLPPAVLDDEAAVRALKSRADSLGIKLQLAHGSVCPNSRSFNAKTGNARGPGRAGAAGVSDFRRHVHACVLGGDPERPQIDMHIDNMIARSAGSARGSWIPA